MTHVTEGRSLERWPRRSGLSPCLVVSGEDHDVTKQISTTRAATSRFAVAFVLTFTRRVSYTARRSPGRCPVGLPVTAWGGSHGLDSPQSTGDRLVLTQG
jgi:hypothetical protein